MYTISWYGIETGSHTLFAPFIDVATNFSRVFAIMSWHRNFIQYCMLEGKLYVTFLYICSHICW